MDAGLLENLVDEMTIDTAYGPQIVIKKPFAPDGGPDSAATAAAKALKPKITFRVGDQLIVRAPYGDPGPTKWPLIVEMVTVTGVALAGLIVLWTIASHKKRGKHGKA